MQLRTQQTKHLGLVRLHECGIHKKANDDVSCNLSTAPYKAGNQSSLIETALTGVQFWRLIAIT